MILLRSNALRSLFRSRAAVGTGEVRVAPPEWRAQALRQEAAEVDL